MKKTAAVRFIGDQEHYRLGCEKSSYAYCRDCKSCSGSNNYKFIKNGLYNAYFLEFWQGERKSLHIKGEDNKIDDFVSLDDFEIVSDEDNVLNQYEALVMCVTHKYDELVSGLTYGKVYKAIGFDNGNHLLVMDDSWDCYFYPRENFEVVSDPHDILNWDTNDYVYDWDETHTDSIENHPRRICPNTKQKKTMKKKTASNQDINAFATKYFDLYRNPKTKESQVEHGFDEECFALGFEMDSGDSFCEKYPMAFTDATELDKIIEEIDDPQFLGTAIFSLWRYVTHWTYASSLLDETYRSWLITAFGRLVAITSEDNSPPYVFFGNIKRIKINSNNIYYGLLPKADLEVEQHITLTDDGRVWITRYAFSEDLNYCKLKKTEQKQFKIDSKKAKFLLEKYTKYFRDEYEITFATDTGDFEMHVTDDQGKKAVFIGPLICDFEVDGYNLSQLLRDTLDDQSLFVFDGNNYECVDRITIDHEYKKDIVGKDGQKVTWNPVDHIVIDRATETIEYIYKIGEECDVTRKYHVAEGVSSFLDGLDIENLFTDFEEKDDTVQKPEGEESSYRIVVEFHRNEPRIIEGSYDKQGLPTDWPEFIENMYSFMDFYGFGEMFAETHYGRTYRKKGEYIFLSVRFGNYGKTYYYLTEDNTIDIGDQVVVPVGDDGTERIVEVEDVEYFSPKNVPMPIEKVKSIIGKFTHPIPNENGQKMIYCPMCEKEIHEDDCFDILYDPLTKEIPGLITEEEIKNKSDICERCKYHDE